MLLGIQSVQRHFIRTMGVDINASEMVCYKHQMVGDSMRTTLTLDDDVAALIRKAMRKRGGTLKDVVNAAIRDGLRHELRPTRRDSVELPVFSGGRALIGSVDNVAELLSVAEGEQRK